MHPFPKLLHLRSLVVHERHRRPNSYCTEGRAMGIKKRRERLADARMLVWSAGIMVTGIEPETLGHSAIQVTTFSPN